MSISFEIDPSRFKFFLRASVTRKIVCCAEGRGICDLSGTFDGHGNQITKVTLRELPKDEVHSPSGINLNQVADMTELFQNQFALMKADPASFLKKMKEEEGKPLVARVLGIHDGI